MLEDGLGGREEAVVAFQVHRSICERMEIGHQGFSLLKACRKTSAWQAVTILVPYGVGVIQPGFNLHDATFTDSSWTPPPPPHSWQP
jgi:hypothetical protein